MKKLLALLLLFSFPVLASQGYSPLPTTTPPGLSGTQLAIDVNSNNDALLTTFSGPTSPGSPVKGQFFTNTSNNKLQFYDGSLWDTIGTFGSGTFLINASQITGTLPPADVPPPTSVTLGGIFSIAPVSHQFLTSVGTSGTITQAQPAFSDLSGTANLSSQASGTLQAAQFPALTGDLTTTAGSLATTLATVNSNTGSFGSSTAIPTITYDGKGRATGVSTNAVIAPAGTLSGTTLASTVVNSSLTSAAGGSFGTAAFTAIGTSGAVIPLLNGNLKFSGTDTFTNPVAINLNAVNLPAAQTGTLFNLGNADGVNTRIQMNSFGASNFLSSVAYGGTNASPVTVGSNTEIIALNSRAYNGTAVPANPNGDVGIFTANTQTTGDASSYIRFLTTPKLSTTGVDVGHIESDGGITWPSTVTGGSKGSGTINAQNLYINGAAVGGNVAGGTAGQIAIYATTGSNLTGQTPVVLSGDVTVTSLGTSTVGAIQNISTAGLATIGTATWIPASNGTNGFVWQAPAVQTLGTSATNPAPYGTNVSNDGLYETSTVPVAVACGGVACLQANQYGIAIGTSNSVLPASGSQGITLPNNAQQFVTVGSSASGVGLNLNLQAGTAFSGAGGTLNLVSGQSTSGQASQIRLSSYNGSTKVINIMLESLSGTASAVGIGTTTITSNANMTFGPGNASVLINANRAQSGGGNSFTIQAGGGISLGTNVNGGNLVLSSGVSTGTGTSNIQLETYHAGSTGTADNSATVDITDLAGSIGIGTSTPQTTLDVNGDITMESGTAGALLCLTSAHALGHCTSTASCTSTCTCNCVAN